MEGDTGRMLMILASAAGGVLGTYHGYKRNNSIGWALWWGFAGSLVPFITLPLSLAQGFGQPAQGVAGYFAR